MNDWGNDASVRVAFRNCASSSSSHALQSTPQNSSNPPDALPSLITMADSSRTPAARRGLDSNKTDSTATAPRRPAVGSSASQRSSTTTTRPSSTPKSSSSSSTRPVPGSTLNKPPTRPTSSTTAKRAGLGARATSDAPTEGSVTSGDEKKTGVGNGVSKRMSTLGSSTTTRPSATRPTSTSDRRSTIAPSTIARRPTIESRTNVASPSKTASSKAAVTSISPATKLTRDTPKSPTKLERRPQSIIASPVRDGVEKYVTLTAGAEGSHVNLSITANRPRQPLLTADRPPRRRQKPHPTLRSNSASRTRSVLQNSAQS